MDRLDIPEGISLSLRCKKNCWHPYALAQEVVTKVVMISRPQIHAIREIVSADKILPVGLPLAHEDVGGLNSEDG